MQHIILYQPAIPTNTGNIGRLCAVTAFRLHLIHPLGFEISDKQLKRAGLDYWHKLDVVEHENWESFKRHPKRPELDRIFLFTTKSKISYWNISYKIGDALLFGSETAGCPQWLHDEIGNEHRVNIPHITSDMRSLNLSNSVAIASYEVLRQTAMRRD